MTKDRQDVYWNADAIGNEYKTTTWFRITPELRNFYTLIKEKEQIAGVILSDDSLNMGFILTPKTNE